MNSQQINQAKQAFQILRNVARVALLNEDDRNNTNAAINILNQFLEEEQINALPKPAGSEPAVLPVPQ